MRYERAAARARGLEQAASFTRALVAYMDETDAETADEALDRLQASPLHSRTILS